MDAKDKPWQGNEREIRISGQTERDGRPLASPEDRR
jgi:hypothetical protein